MLPTPKFCPAFELTRIKFAPQARSDLGDLTELIASIKEHGILQPPSIMEDGTVICGHRRVEAAKRAGLAAIPVMVYPPLPPVQVRLLQLTENIQRADMDHRDIFRECFLLLEGGLQRQEIAKAMGVSPPTVTRWLSPSECPKEARDAFDAGKLTLGQMDKIRVSLEPLTTLDVFLGRAPVAAAEEGEPAASPAESEGDGPTTGDGGDKKGGAVKVELPGGSIVVKCKGELSLAGVVALLGEAHEQAKNSHGLQQSLRTFVGVMRDRAKKTPTEPRPPRKKRVKDDLAAAS